MPLPVQPLPTAPGVRLIGLIIAGVCLGVLLVAAWLSPEGDGHGTHTQLGMPRCNWVSLFDLPCPTCGMTTAFAHAADGDLPAAARAQPMGSLMAISGAVVFWAGLHTGIAGVRLDTLLGRLISGRRWLVLLGLLIASWVYKIVTWQSG